VILQAVRAGEDLTRALTKSQWFPEAFLQMVAVAEEGGRVPELMKHQAAFYQDDATRRMKTLVRIAGSVIWFGVALFMVIMILRLAGIYLAALGA